MAELWSIVYMYHILFIHSSVDGHLGCLLAIVHSATLSTGMYVYLQKKTTKFYYLSASKP